MLRQRRVGSTLRVAVLVSVAAAAPLLARYAWADSERNLMLARSFADSAAGWAGWNAVVTRAPGDIGGPGAVKVEWTGRSRSFSLYTLPRPLVHLRPGATFTASASVFSPEQGRHVCLLLREWSADADLIAIRRSCVVTTRGWDTFDDVTYTTRTHGAELELLIVQGEPRRGDSFIVDDVTLVTADT